jgi:hypothetical protein
MLLKWKQLTGQTKGQELVPKTFLDYIKQIFYQFADYNIQYNYKEDFNKDGQFHGPMIQKWEKQRKIDPTYDT